MNLPLSSLRRSLALLCLSFVAGGCAVAGPVRPLPRPVYEPTVVTVRSPAEELSPTAATSASPPASAAGASETVAPPAAFGAGEVVVPVASAVPAAPPSVGESLIIPPPVSAQPSSAITPAPAIEAAAPGAARAVEAPAAVVLPHAAPHPAMPVDPAALLAAEQEQDKAAAVPVPEPAVTATGEVPAAGCVLPAPDDDEDDDVLPPPDPDAVEEIKVLSGEGQAPPEDEGLSAPADAISFDFPVVENQKVQYYIDYFTGPGRKVFTRWLERTTRYLPRMQEVFAEHGLPLDLTYLSIVESGLNPRAYSCAHASGPWQFIPGTGKLFGLDSNWWVDERRDVDKATVAAALYLKELYTLFQGDWYLAVASYNAGAGKMLRAIARSNSRDFWELARTRHIKDETKNYVPQLLAVLLLARQADKYGFTGLSYQAPVGYETVTIPTTTDLAVVARLAGTDYQTVKDLNPELKRWCTPPGVKDYLLRLPLGTAEKFLAAYADLPEAERVNYAYHRVERGDTLKGVGKRYGVDPQAIVAVNPPRKKKGLKVGSSLLIPLRQGVPPIPAEDLVEDPVVRRVAVAVAKSHTVRKGETLAKIARRYGVKPADLARWNKLGTKAGVRPGQVLALKAPKGSKGGGKESTRDGRIYTVKRGDTFYSIARRNAVSVEQLLDWNNLSKRSVLRPGQNLTLYGKGG